MPYETHATRQKQFWCGLTHEQIEAACRNFGIDLRCGRCASSFYTGFDGNLHDQGCETLEELRHIR